MFPFLTGGNVHASFDDFDPFEFKCDSCGKTRVFTEAEIEVEKKKIPGGGGDCYLLCRVCKEGHMQPPVVVQTSGIFE
jgi:hypothetical protein